MNPRAPAQCPGDAGYDSTWTYQTRAILKEGPGKQAIQELFTGPLPGKSEPTLTSALPAASRLVSLRIENGAAHMDVSRATEIGGGSCSMGVRVDQIRKTLMQFPTVKTVKISIEGRTGDVIFQP